MASGRSTTVAVIGAGPIGIEAAAALKRESIPYLHFEAGCIGATMEWWAPETVFYSSSDLISIAGVPLANPRQSKASREEYLTYLRSVVEQFELPIETNRRLVSLSKNDTAWKLSLAPSLHGVGGPAEQLAVSLPKIPPDETVSAEKVILAIGDMHKPRLIGVPGEELPHVGHYFPEPHRFFGKQVVILGGKNSAIEAAIRLVRVGAKVTLCCRGEVLDPKRIKFWLLPEIKSLIRRRILNFLPNTVFTEIGSNYVTAKSAGTEEEVKIAADFVLLLTGYEQDPDLYKQAGVRLEGEGKKPAYNPDTMESNKAGLYTIGTGAAGTQIGGVSEFIETSHIHVRRVIAHLKGEEPPQDEELRDISQREM